MFGQMPPQMPGQIPPRIGQGPYGFGPSQAFGGQGFGSMPGQAFGGQGQGGMPGQAFGSNAGNSMGGMPGMFPGRGPNMANIPSQAMGAGPFASGQFNPMGFAGQQPQMMPPQGIQPNGQFPTQFTPRSPFQGGLLGMG